MIRLLVGSRPGPDPASSLRVTDLMTLSDLTASLDGQPIFSPEPVRQLRDMLGDGMVTELVDEFESSSPPTLERLEQAIAAGDLRSCQREVHSLKSAAASLGLCYLSALCLSLERECRDGRGVTPEQAAFLRESYRAACSALSSLKA